MSQPQKKGSLKVTAIILACLLIFIPCAIFRLATVILGSLYGRLNLLRRYFRLSIAPWVRTSVLRQPLPTSAAIADILPLIFAHLDDPDLARCCRVNRLCFEVAGRALYSSAKGVPISGEKYYRWQKCTCEEACEHAGVLVAQRRRRLLAECERYDSDKQDLKSFVKAEFALTLGAFANRPPYPISKPKLSLLEHIRHLRYTAEQIKRPHNTVDTTHMFPHLHTLTMQLAEPSVNWDDPFLSNLRPSHIRLVHLPSLQIPTPEIPLLCNSALGQRAEKITIHIMCGELRSVYKDFFKVNWPSSTRQIDIVFMAPNPAVGSASPDERISPYYNFTPAQPPNMRMQNMTDVSLEIAQLLGSASMTQATVRVVGLHESLPSAAEDEMFRELLKEDLVAEMEDGQVERQRAEQRAEELVYVSLGDYVQEEGFLSF